jgi:hypothetical protein
MNRPIIINDNETNIENEIPLFIQEELCIRINQSTLVADDYLKNNRPRSLINNIIKINGYNIDMYEELINKDNFNPNEFAIIAKSKYNNSDMWFARKTDNNLVQYYHFTDEDSFSIASLFSLFIEGYTQTTLFERLGKIYK